MSGDGLGWVVGAALVIPVVAAAAVVAAAGAVIAGAAAGVNALYNHHKRKQEEINLACDSLNAELNQSYANIQRTIDQHNAESEAAYQRARAEIERATKQIKTDMNRVTAENAAEITHRINNAQINIKSIISRNETKLKTEYAAAVNAEVGKAHEALYNSYSSGMSKIKLMQENTQARAMAAKKLAQDSIADARAALAVFKRNFPQKDAGVIEMQISAAQTQFANGLYETAAQAAIDTVLNILTQTNEALIEKNSKDATAGFVLSEIARLRERLDGERYLTFTYGDKQYMEDIKEFSSGFYTRACEKLDSIYERVRDGKIDSMSAAEVDGLLREIDLDFIPFMETMFEFSINNIANAYHREDVGDVVIQALEDQNFRLEEVVNVGENRGEAILIKVKNDITGEEIVVSLNPEDDPETGKVNTGIEISMFDFADPTDEKRKAAMREYICGEIQAKLGHASQIGCDATTVRENSHKERDFNAVRERKPRHQQE